MTDFRCEECDKEFGSKDALDMHNRSKHQESYKEPFFSKKRKKKIRNYAILLILVLLVGGYIYLRSVSLKSAPSMEIEPSEYNFGSVSQAKGTVTATMTIKNNGVSDLVLKNMDSSCGCTSASVIYKGVEGPKFSMAMHGTNPKDWKQVIPPGDSAQLKVYYNPNVHKDMRGAFTRSITIFSNDPRNKIKTVDISGVQTD